MPAHSKQSKARNSHVAKTHINNQSPMQIQIVQGGQNSGKVQQQSTRNQNASLLNNSSNSGDGDDEYENDFELSHANRGLSKSKHPVGTGRGQVQMVNPPNGGASVLRRDEMLQ